MIVSGEILAIIGQFLHSMFLQNLSHQFDFRFYSCSISLFRNATPVFCVIIIPLIPLPTPFYLSLPPYPAFSVVFFSTLSLLSFPFLSIHNVVYNESTLRIIFLLRCTIIMLHKSKFYYKTAKPDIVVSLGKFNVSKGNLNYYIFQAYKPYVLHSHTPK